MLVAEERVSVCNIFPDQAYLAGVFRDCGVPLLMERFPAYCQSMHLDEHVLWFNLAEEDRKYQTDHAVVGYFVAKHWKLPPGSPLNAHHSFPNSRMQMGNWNSAKGRKRHFHPQGLQTLRMWKQPGCHQWPERPATWL